MLTRIPTQMRLEECSVADPALQLNKSNPTTLCLVKRTMIALGATIGAPEAAKTMPRLSPNVWMTTKAICKFADGTLSNW